MKNERLRATLLQAGVTPTELAQAVGVDVKTIERWIGSSRVPYRRHRYLAAKHLQVDEMYLWPDALAPSQVADASESEILALYPHRWTVPRDTWARFFDVAEQEIGILVYAGLFLAEDVGLIKLIREKADASVAVRLLLGDPDGAAIASRGAEEGVDDAMAARIRNVLKLLRGLRTSDAVEVRLHGTVLYNSIYRADDELLVNPHIYGSAGSQAPVLHLRRVAGGGMVTTYLDSFERVWAGARPLDPDS